MVDDADLRPFERRVLRLSRGGLDNAEIARRFRRSPQFVERVIDLTRVPRQHSPARPARDRLRPVERRVLKWRDGGTTTDDIAARFRRSPRHVEQVERLARYKLAR
jgi:DNA-binding CsgD family transcriptional regulator